MPRRITPEDLYKIRQPGECRLSPGGTRLAVVVSQSDKETLKRFSNIWVVPTGGGEPRQFTQGKYSDGSPRFSPDGRTIAFLSNRSGKSEVWTIPTDGGEARQLTKLQGSVSNLAFSPNGKKLAVVFTPLDAEAKEREANQKKGLPGQEAPKVRAIERIFYKLDGAGFIPKERSHLWLVDVESGRAKQMTDDDRYDESHPVFSPDGKWIYFNSNRTADPDVDLEREQIWRIPARGGAVEKIRTFDGPSSGFSISPDGEWIAFHGHPDADAPWGTKHTKLWLVRAGGGRPVELTANLDRTCTNTTINDTFGTGSTAPPIWSPDSQWVHFVISNEGNTEIWGSHIRKRKAAPVVNRRGAVLHYDIHFASGSIYATFSDPHTPGEVYFLSMRETQVARHLTTFNEWLKKLTVVLPEEFWFEGKGRHRLQGWVLPGRHPAGGKTPAILYIHGGPGTQYGRVFFHEFQVLAARGYTVIFSNPRGGTGYSEKHYAAIHNAWGTVDYDDLMRFTDESLRRFPFIDRRRLGVAGGSYGGYMTSWIIGHTDRFAAAVTQRAVVNLASFWGSSDFGYAWYRSFGGKLAWRDPQHYLKMSPITYVDAVKTPTLIEHQENDQRCSIEQAEQLFAALKLRKVPTEFHRYPGESHGMSRGGRPDRRIERIDRIVAWFDSWLKPRTGRSRSTGRRPRGRR
jgi:dipeptidyl aminopeptidase/acylaminoacyl peptidase